MTEDVGVLTAEATSLSRAKPRRSSYFVALATVLFATVLLGFGRTFFARALFDVPPLPWYGYAHGAILTAWFALLVAQVKLIGSGRAHLHRRLGAAGAFVAAAVVAISLVMVLGLPARMKAGMFFGEVPFDATVARIIVCSDLAALAVFALYVAIALAYRRRSAVHKRLMVLASIVIVGPASARLGLMVAAHTTLPSWSQGAIQGVFFLGLPLTLVVYDLRTEGRVLRTTIAGVMGVLASTIVGAALALSPVGAALMAALE